MAWDSRKCVVEVTLLLSRFFGDLKAWLSYHILYSINLDIHADVAVLFGEKPRSACVRLNTVCTHFSENETLWQTGKDVAIDGSACYWIIVFTVTWVYLPAIDIGEDQTIVIQAPTKSRMSKLKTMKWVHVTCIDCVYQGQAKWLCQLPIILRRTKFHTASKLSPEACRQVFLKNVWQITPKILILSILQTKEHL